MNAQLETPKPNITVTMTWKEAQTLYTGLGKASFSDWERLGCREVHTVNCDLYTALQKVLK